MVTKSVAINSVIFKLFFSSKRKNKRKFIYIYLVYSKKYLISKIFFLYTFVCSQN